MTTIKFTPYCEEPHYTRCPQCSEVLVQRTKEQSEARGQQTLYSDGDFLLLGGRLLRENLITRDDIDQYGDGLWFDQGALWGECPFCKADYYGASLAMIAPEAENPGEIYDTYFLHNEPHEPPVCYLASSTHGYGENQQWLTGAYHTKQGLVLDHLFGPFGYESDGTEAVDLEDMIATLWPSLVAAVRGVEGSPQIKQA